MTVTQKVGAGVQRCAAWIVARPWFWVLLVLALLSWPIVRSIRTHLPSPFPVHGTLPEFRLLNQEGHPVGSDALRGRVLAMSFFFSRCEEPCRPGAEAMAKIQHHTRGLGPAFRLVSISTDPGYDTPPRLLEYAKARRASRFMWMFLGGDASAIQAAALDALRASLGRDPTAAERDALLRGSSLMLVDQRRRIRGFYAAADQAAVDSLVRDAGLLVNLGF